MICSQPQAESGRNTISGSVQWIPSSLEHTAIDFFGRHEKYMSNFALLPFTMFTSKHVPSLTGSPRTGLPAYLTHPFPFCAVVSTTASEEIAMLAATAATKPANFLNCIGSSFLLKITNENHHTKTRRFAAAHFQSIDVTVSG